MPMNTSNLTVQTSPITIPFAPDRLYLCVIATAEMTITLDTMPAFTLAAGAVWNPNVGVMNSIAFTGTGAVITG
jgi:hypothetical protein